MKVAMYYRNSDVRLEEAQKPKAGSGELLMKVMASGICGSDIMEWYRIKKAPLVLGHEVSGTVEEAGKGVKGFRKGERIVATHHVPCGACHYCSGGNETMCETLRTTKFYPGGFAQYLRIPEINVKKGTFRLPAGVSFDEGTFVEPLGCVVRGQKKIGIGKGQTVLVIGSGLSGILNIKLAKARSAGRIIATDVSEARLRAAEAAGADAVLNAREDVPARVREENNGRAADRVILCTGVLPAVRQAFASVDRGGTILFYAPTLPDEEFPIKIEDLWKNGITLATTYAASPADLKEAISLIASGKVMVNDMITDRLGLAQAGEGFRKFAEGKAMKVIIRPNG
ncbi:MAG: alcohol dehydrogenase catalytic domain-containing protein [Candidatus Aenigmatarchaeota archaeon]